jgi:hypothetical protein
LHLYLQKPTPAGLLAIHISNNRLNLEPIVANLGYDNGIVGPAQQDLLVTPAER